MRRAVPTAERDTKDSGSEVSAYHPPKIPPCVRFWPFRRKAGMYHTHFPPLEGTTLSSHSGECREKPSARTRTNPISQRPWKPNQNQEKLAMAYSFWGTYHLQGQTLLSCLHPPCTRCAPNRGHHLLSHIFEEKLPSQQRWTSTREVSNSLSNPWSCLL